LFDLLAAADQAREKSNFKKAEALYRKAGGPDGWMGAADCCRLLGRFPQAVKSYQKAISILKFEDPSRMVDAKVGLALSFRGMGKPGEALSLLKQAKRFYYINKDSEGCAFIDWSLGTTLRIAGNMREARQYLESALKQYQKLKLPEGVAYVSCALGGVWRMLGDYAKSRKFYSFANQAMSKRHDTFGTAYSYCGLGNTYRMNNDHSEALKYFKKAERIYATIGDKVSYAYTVWSIGTSLKMLGGSSQAKAAYSKCERLFKNTGDPRGLAYARMGFAELELLKGNASGAVKLLKRAKINAKPFAWESLHIKYLMGKLDSKRYSKEGSKFRPQGVPVNWP
jgi:tetratricopeptide (TPR) repeat protein